MPRLLRFKTTLPSGDEYSAFLRGLFEDRSLYGNNYYGDIRVTSRRFAFSTQGTIDDTTLKMLFESISILEVHCPLQRESPVDLLIGNSIQEQVILYRHYTDCKPDDIDHVEYLKLLDILKGVFDDIVMAKIKEREDCL